MPIIVDAHQDLAWNVSVFKRDYTRSVQETRQLERGLPVLAHNGNTLLGWDEYQHGQVAISFSTLFVPPKRSQVGEWDKPVYDSFDEAHRFYRAQVDIYQRLFEEHPDKFAPLRSVRDLDLHLAKWQNPEDERFQPPVGLVMLMEGADAIRHPEELEEWWQLGLRIIGLAWTGTCYSGGTNQPGPLTDEGRNLLAAMADFNFTLDLSHMDEVAVLQALDIYPGPIIASHSNASALLRGDESNRHLTDDVIRGIIERDGVIGIVPFNAFLKAGWRMGDPRTGITLDDVVAQIDYICQMAGDARHVGLGSDFDGGFGLESVPEDVDTIADLQKLAPLLESRGYTGEDIAAILGENFIHHLRKSLPTL